MPTFREKAAVLLAEVEVSGCLEKKAALTADLANVLRKLGLWCLDRDSEHVLLLLLSLCDIDSGTFSIDEMVDVLEEEHHARGL